MGKKLTVAVSAVIMSFFVACPQPEETDRYEYGYAIGYEDGNTNGYEDGYEDGYTDGYDDGNADDTEIIDKNTMKGEWAFFSATDGVTYGNIIITNIGTADTATYENIWPDANPWDGLREIFAVIVENDDLKNIIFDIPLYSNQEKTIELLECSSAIGGTMKLKNWTDSITYTYERSGN